MGKSLVQKAEAWGISEEILKRILDQTEAEYPKESCGVIIGAAESYDRLKACRNVQDDYHSEDPENFPRTSRTAYWIDPKDLFALQKELRGTKEQIRVIYHSHIDAGAYFSPEDVKMALLSGRPAYPEVKYLVVSVKSGKADGLNLYAWNESKKEFLMCE